MTLQEVFEINIFNLPQLKDLPYKEKEKLGNKITQEILETVVEEIADELPEEKAEEFMKLFTESASEEAREQFLNEYVLNFEEKMVRETLVLKDELVRFLEEKRTN